MPFARIAAKVLKEPSLTNAARLSNVSFYSDGQKRDKIKADFAKGLCHKVIHRFRNLATYVTKTTAFVT
jgi:hypothetical protein